MDKFTFADHQRQSQIDLFLLCFYYRGRKIYEPPRYMSVCQAAEQLVEVVRNKKEEGQTNLGMITYS